MTRMEAAMMHQHFYDQHHEPFWTVTIETLWMLVLASAVIGSFIMGLSALAH
jgi:hypothetical protein